MEAGRIPLLQLQAAQAVVGLTLIQMVRQVLLVKDMPVVKALFMRQVALLNQAVEVVALLVLVRLAHPAQAAMVVLAFIVMTLLTVRTAMMLQFSPVLVLATDVLCAVVVLRYAGVVVL